MADDTKPKDAPKPAEQPQAPQAPPALTDAERAELAQLRAEKAAAVAAAPAPEPEQRADETIPGGRYMVDGQLVNALGEPIDSKGNVKK